MIVWIMAVLREWRNVEMQPVAGTQGEPQGKQSRDETLELRNMVG